MKTQAQCGVNTHDCCTESSSYTEFQVEQVTLTTDSLVTWQPIRQYCVEHRNRTPLAREHQDVIGEIILDIRSTTERIII
jgi:hypothetical protein